MSVLHLLQKTFTYKACNTFTDYTLAFTVSMPTSYWLECFRDNVVFPVYLYQRWFHLWIKAERTYLRSFTRKIPRGNLIQTKCSSTSGEPLCSWLQAEQSLDLVLWKHSCNSLDITSLAFPELLNVPHRSPQISLFTFMLHLERTVGTSLHNL